MDERRTKGGGHGSVTIHLSLMNNNLQDRNFSTTQHILMIALGAGTN